MEVLKIDIHTFYLEGSWKPTQANQNEQDFLLVAEMKDNNPGTGQAQKKAQPA